VSTVVSRHVLGVATLAATFFCHGAAQAHFVLQAPPASLQQSGLGDPQKAPPCGDDGTAVATDIVTAFQGGDTITITIDETVYHPGHYRIALAINDPSELPEPPPVTRGDQACGTAPIMDPPVFPVLADGVFVHTAPFAEPQSIDITLPDDVSCTNCTLQVIQFMSEHGLNVPGGCFYHHCATISIEATVADGSTTTPSDDSGTSAGDGSTSAPGTSSADDSASNSQTDASATDASASATEITSATATDTTGTASLGSDDGDDESGCSCSSSASGPRWAMPLLLVGLVAGRRRGSRRR